MASAQRTIDTDVIQVRTVYARTPQNGFIPSSHVLIANGDGSTRWNSVSSIFEVSSFKTLRATSQFQPTAPASYSADLLNNAIRISTQGVEGILEPYLVAANSTLMLSNYLPPIAVYRDSATSVNNVFVTNNTTTDFLLPSTGYSTIKFHGVNDIKFSTIADARGIFVSISSFTSAGYSTISGETFRWRPVVTSTFSTAQVRASFISSIQNFVYPNGTATPQTGIPMSNATGSADLLLMSTIGFRVDPFLQHLDTSRESTTRMFINVRPSYFLPVLTADGTNTLVKRVVSYLTLSTSAGFVTMAESSNVSWLTTQVTGANLSNSFTQPLLLEVNPYLLWSNLNNGTSNSQLYLTVNHQIIDGKYQSGTRAGFNIATNSNYDNQTSYQGGLFINVQNSAPGRVFGQDGAGF